MALPVRTSIPLAGANALMASHNLYNFQGLYPTAGNIFFVHNSGSSTGSGLSPGDAISTLDGAVGLCTANQGDVIIILPGHAETIGSATGCVLDVAGIRVLGLGSGTLKPVLTIDTATTALISITAANCLVENIRVASNLDNIAKGIDVGANADGLTLRNVELVDGASNKEMLIHINIATGCNDVTLDGVRIFGLGGGATAGIKFAGTSDNFRMLNCELNGTWSAAAVDASAGILLKQSIHDNFICNEDTSAGLCYKGNASSTGFMCRNFVMGTKNNTETISTVNAMHFAENYGTDTVATTGILTPSTATAWA